MKQIAFLSALILLLAVSCKKRDVTPGVTPTDVVVSVSFTESFGNLAANSAVVTAKNVQTSIEKKGNTDAEGRVIFTGLMPGVYDFKVSFTLTPAQYLEIFKQTTPTDVVFNASSLNQVINNTSGLVQVLKLQTGVIGNLLLKQIYYAGSHTSDGASFRDEFVEVYNNSNETIYLDGIYIGMLTGKANSTVFPYTQADGQFDWNKSLNMPTEISSANKANTDYLYTKTLYQFPGTGTQYPLQPGKSAVIAQNAINHKANYIRPDGKTVEIKNPELTVDLSNASFETTHNEGYVFDVTNPAVPDMVLIESTINDMVLTPTHEGIILFKAADKDKINNASAYAQPNVTTITTATKLYKQIPLADIELLDAVEIQESATKQVPRKLTSAMDNSFTFVPGGGYSSQSVIRKVARNFGDRKVLQDTNNSSEDFIYLNKANPFGW